MDAKVHWFHRIKDDLKLHLALEPTTDKWFPVSNSAKEVRDKLLTACQEAGCTVSYGKSFESLKRAPEGWLCKCADGSRYTASRVVREFHGSILIDACLTVFMLDTLHTYLRHPERWLSSIL